MAEEKTKVISLKVDSNGGPLELDVDGQPLLISQDQIEQGNELLGVLAKAGSMVSALQSQGTRAVRGCQLINGKWICT